MSSSYVSATLLNKAATNNGSRGSYNGNSPQLTRNDDNCCSFKDWVVFVICILGMVGSCWLFVWSVTVHVPFTFKVESLEVASMTTISNNPSSGGIQKYMSANLNLTLSLTHTNTNQELLIEPLVVSIMYDDDFLSSEKMDPLYLSPQSHKSIQLDMGITISTAASQVSVDSIATDLAINQSLVFKILIQGRYSILNSGARDENNYGVAITCEQVKVQFLRESNLTSGIMVNGPCSCKHIFA